MDMKEKLRAALAEIQSHGYQIREEWLDGAGGGACEIHGRKVYFEDISASLPERLETAEVFLRELGRFSD